MRVLYGRGQTPIGACRVATSVTASRYGEWIRNPSGTHAFG
jgi:hypothetical protein